MQWRKQATPTQLVSLYSVYWFEPFPDALKFVELLEAIYPIVCHKTELMQTKGISLGTQREYRWLKWTKNHGPGAMFPIDWHMCLHINLVLWHQGGREGQIHSWGNDIKGPIQCKETQGSTFSITGSVKPLR